MAEGLAGLREVLSLLESDVISSIHLIRRLDQVAEVSSLMRVVAEFDPDTLEEIAAQASPVGRWAADVRCWRDHYREIAASHAGGGAEMFGGWVRLDALVDVHARLVTTDFAVRARGTVLAMAHYLDRAGTGCPDHAAWAALLRAAADLHQEVIDVHLTGRIKPGWGSEWDDLLGHPEYRAVVCETATSRLLTGLLAALSGMAEYFDAEHRRLVAVA